MAIVRDIPFLTCETVRRLVPSLRQAAGDLVRWPPLLMPQVAPDLAEDWARLHDAVIDAVAALEPIDRVCQAQLNAPLPWAPGESEVDEDDREAVLAALLRRVSILQVEADLTLTLIGDVLAPDAVAAVRAVRDGSFEVLQQLQATRSSAEG